VHANQVFCHHWAILAAPHYFKWTFHNRNILAWCEIQCILVTSYIFRLLH
jgi:hypothetical protein